MAQVSLRRVVLAAAALASVLVLAACAPGRTPAEHFAGLPAAPPDPIEAPSGDPEWFAQWLDEGGKISITTFGSSGCPVRGTHIQVIEPQGQGNTVEIATHQYPDDIVCTMDYVPYTTVFWTPMNITTTEVLTVKIDGQELSVPIK